MRAAFRWDIPQALNLAEVCCERWARTDPGRVAVHHIGPPDEVWTFADLKRASDGLAVALAAKGIGRGDRVAIAMAQNPRVLVAHLAAWKLGAVSLPLFTLFGEDALRYRLSDSGAAVVIVDAAFEERVRAVAGEAMIVSADLDPAMASDARGFEMARTGSDDPAVMIYTSGTTGDPKGVLHAHRFLYGHLPCLELAYDGFPKAGDVGWTPADWAWIGGLMDMAVPCLFHGVPQISHRFEKFDPEAAFAFLERHPVTISFLPPTALRMLRQAKVPQALGLRAVGSGGEALGGDLLEWGRADLGCPINEFYGQTEANHVVSACHGRMIRRPGAMGFAVPGHDVAVLGAGDVPVSEGEVGEICVAAPDPVMMLRYWKKPEATAAKVVNGWLRTGDLATKGGDGQLVFHARDDDIITSAGYRIGPVEIEQALCTHPDVTMAAVVGAPDPVRTEIVVAHVVLRDGAQVTDEALKARVRDKVSAHLVPRRIVRADTLPMTATGKILRRALRGT